MQTLLNLAQLEATISLLEHQEGNVLDKTYAIDQDAITTFHLLKSLCQEVIDTIEEVDPDIVTFIYPLTEIESSAFYNELKDSYAHFYKFQDLDNRITAPLFVVSKYEIDTISCHYNKGEGSSFPSSYFFDFLIKKGNLILAHQYTGNLSNIADEETLLRKMEADHLEETDKSLPFFYSENLSLNKEIKTKHLFDRHNETLALYSKLANNRHTFSHWGTLLCKNEKTREGGYYDFSASRQWESESTRASGELGYYRETENGRFKAGVEAKVEKDKQGNTNTSTSFHATGEF